MSRSRKSKTRQIARYAAALLLALGLSACQRSEVISADPKSSSTPEYEVCPEALARPSSRRAFQSLDGWFFFNHDFKTNYEMLTPEQSDFVVQLSRAFMAEGILLVAVPVPGRAAIEPARLYLRDPKQAAFSTEAARAYYDTYQESLEESGVAVVDVMAVATDFDANGGQTFFKRDLHWTPEGANAVAQATAEEIRRRLGHALPKARWVLERSTQDKTHKGRFINNWLYSACGYTLPAEPLGDYTVSRQQAEPKPPRVVQAGSSFGGSPFDQGFLSVALQSDVLNVSVGNGGPLLALENYLASHSYKNTPPQILVWEYPVFWQPLSKAAQRRLLAGVYGSCEDTDIRYEETKAAMNQTLILDTPVSAAEHYLSLAFSDLTLLHFGVTLTYEGNVEETLSFDRPKQIAEQNQGRFFTTLGATPAAVESIELEFPTRAAGTVAVQVCHNP